MGIFNIIIIIPAIFLYGLFGVACLKIIKIPVGLFTLGSFILFGGVSGVLTLIFYGAVVADENSQLNSTMEVIGMFVASGLMAIFASIVSAKISKKYNKSRKRKKTGTKKTGTDHKKTQRKR